MLWGKEEMSQHKVTNLCLKKVTNLSYTKSVMLLGLKGIKYELKERILLFVY